MNATRCGFAIGLALLAPGAAARAQEDGAPRAAPVRQADDEDRPHAARRRSAEGDGEALSGQRRRGFAFYGALGTKIGLVSAAMGQAPGSEALLQGELFLGYKVSRVVLGVAADFTAAAAGGRAAATVLVSPEVQVALARSGDGRVEMLGVLKVGAGTVILGQGTPPVVLAYQVAPGVRYWPHPQFAASLLAGVAGTHLLAIDRFSTEHQAAVGIFVALGGLGVF